MSTSVRIREVQILVLPLASCVTSDKLLSVSELQLSGFFVFVFVFN